MMWFCLFSCVYGKNRANPSGAGCAGWQRKLLRAPTSHRWQDGWLCSGKSGLVMWHLVNTMQMKLVVRRLFLICEGASVISSRCSQTYTSPSPCLTLFGIPLWSFYRGPRIAIQVMFPRGFHYFGCLWRSFFPMTTKTPFCIPQASPIIAGQCWPFVGAEGTLAVSLSHPVKITQVTVDHLPRYNSPTGDNKSAPKDLEVYVSEKWCWEPSSLTPDQLWCLVIVNNQLYCSCDLLPQGMKTQAGEGTFLGRFRYDKFGEPTQTFSLSVSFKPAKIRLTDMFLLLLIFFSLVPPDSHWGGVSDRRTTCPLQLGWERIHVSLPLPCPRTDRCLLRFHQDLNLCKCTHSGNTFIFEYLFMK